MNPQYINLDWNLINQKLKDITDFSGGFTNSSKGILTLDSGKVMFVKKANDPQVITWTRKEIEIYKILNTHDFFFTPQLISYSPDYSIFATDCLSADDDWDWSNNWSEQRLDSTFRTIDALAAIQLSDTEKNIFISDKIRDFINGWQILFDNPTKLNLILQKMAKDPVGRNLEININEELDFSHQFKFVNSTLVHNDIRSDNCPYSASRNASMLVDWPWAIIGDPRIDMNSLLTHVHLSGFDVTQKYADRLNVSALQWLAGYWLSTSTDDQDSPEKLELRNLQFQSGIKALELARYIS